MSRTSPLDGVHAIGALDALDRIDVGLVALDGEASYTYVNAAAATLLGVPREDMLGRRVWDVFPGGVGSPVHRAMERARQTGSPATVEDYSQSRDQWHECRIQPHDDGLHIYFTDITPRVHLERSLRDRVRLVEQLGVGLAVLRADVGNATLEILSVNATLAAILDVDEAGLVGEGVGPDHVLALGMRLDATCLEARRAGATIDLGERSWRGPAGPRTLRVRVAAMNGWDVGVAVEDVTEQRVAADERVELAARLLRAAEDDRHALGAEIVGGCVDTLVATSLHAGTAASTTADPALREQLAAIERDVGASVAVLLGALAGRYPPQLADEGLDAALLVLGAAAGVRVVPVVTGPPVRGAVRDVAYRLVRDAVRAAGAGAVLHVALEGDRHGGLSLTVRTDRTPPVGAIVSAESVDWVRLLPGSVTEGAHPPDGTLVTAQLPGVP
jgi:PAS domain S-box-containing protein